MKRHKVNKEGRKSCLGFERGHLVKSWEDVTCDKCLKIKADKSFEMPSDINAYKKRCRKELNDDDFISHCLLKLVEKRKATPKQLKVDYLRKKLGYNGEKKQMLTAFIDKYEVKNVGRIPIEVDWLFTLSKEQLKRLYKHLLKQL